MQTLYHFRYVIFYVFPGILLFSLISCEESTQRINAITIPQIKDKPAEVKARRISKRSFKQELISNGTLHACERADLLFRTNGMVEKVCVKNGDYILKGTLIAQLHNDNFQNTLDQAVIEIKLANIKYKDILLLKGGIPGNLKNISQDKLDYYSISSGLELAKLKMQQAESQLSMTYLYAPFDGVICNFELNEFNYVNAVEKFGVLLKIDQFGLNFSLLESEAGIINEQFELVAIPVHDPGIYWKAQIKTIDRIVDEHGLIKAQGTLVDRSDLMLDGMHVKVILSRQIENCMVIPKQAVVMRSGRPVVFTSEEGYAKWNYVSISSENQTEYLIESGLEDSCVIIIEGNQNLSHQSPVMPIEW